MATSGTITLNGISDKELARIWELKAKHEGKFNFQPNVLQPILQGNQQMATGRYNNVVFTWPDDQGLKIVHEVIEYILKMHEQSTVAEAR